MLSLYLLYANTPKSTSAKAAPQWIGSPKGTGCTSEVAPTGDGRGELAFINRLPPISPPTPATAKQEPRKSRPLWGKGDRASGGRGELASYLDCPPTNAPTPTRHANKTALTTQGHTTPQANSPPPSPNGPTSHPKGEAKILTQSQCKHSIQSLFMIQ